jgi:hypothetical protein
MLLLTTAALAILALAGCTTSTPASRIAENRSTFDALPEKHQRLVEHGQITNGMAPEAVLLAWGRPERRSEGSDGGVPTMRWTYTGLRPVYHSNVYGGYGWGWGGYRGYRRGYPYVGVSPSVTYVPERRATVLFRNRKVHSWERRE